MAVMGCVVNGPGESKHADIGISLPGTFEEPVAPVFVDGEKTETLRGDDIVPRFLAHPGRLRRAPVSGARQRRCGGARRLSAGTRVPIISRPGRDICYLRIARNDAILAPTK